MTFKEWVIDLFKDERGSISVKPVIAFIGSLILFGTTFANSFSHQDVAPSADLVHACMIVVLAGMGGDTIDKFSHKKKDDSKA
jgi:hypothetical protein